MRARREVRNSRISLLFFTPSTLRRGAAVWEVLP
jgi:hypothetical protein